MKRALALALVAAIVAVPAFAQGHGAGRIRRTRQSRPRSTRSRRFPGDEPYCMAVTALDAATHTA